MDITKVDDLFSMLVGSVEASRDKIYYRTTREEVNFGEFYRRVEEISSFLRKNGVKKGDRVAIISEKSPEQLGAFYGIWSLGAVAVPINEGLGIDETRFILEDSSPNLALVSSKYYKKISDILECAVLEEIDISRDDIKKVDISRDDIAALIYTSGSTGNPKGVMTTHENYLMNSRSSIDGIGVTKEDNFYSLLPYWHSFALTVEVVVPVMARSVVSFADGQRDFAKNIPTFEPSIVLTVPRILEVIKANIEKKVASQGGKALKAFTFATTYMEKNQKTKNPLKKEICRLIKAVVFKKVRATFGDSFRFFISGGAPLDMGLQAYFNNMGVTVTQGYGLSESTPVISVDDPSNISSGSVGPLLDWLTPAHGGEYTFEDSEGNRGIDLEGELLVRGQCVMAGYWNYTDKTAKTIIDGWLYTGDIGYLDTHGKLFIRGRSSNMIVLQGGEKVHPEHVEDIMKKSNNIEDVVVIGEGCKNLYACVTLREELYKEHLAGDEKTIEEIKKEMKKLTSNLAPYQKPKDLIILPNFNPEDGTYTGTMKVRRHIIKEIYSDEIEELLGRK